MNTCNLHHRKTGKRCSMLRAHKGKCLFEILCICGIIYCSARGRRVLQRIKRRKKEVA